MVYIFTQNQANVINWTILTCGTLSGFLYSDVKLWYKNFVYLFFLISIVMNSMGFLIQMLGWAFGRKCQENAPKPPKYLKETIETLNCYYVVAFIAAWPYSNFCQGKLTAYVWTLEESFLGGSILLNVLFVAVFMLFIDFWLYWKHYLLHTPTLWVFHEIHHHFSNPSVQAVFAITPTEVRKYLLFN